MKIAIMSDTHDNLANLDKALQYIKDNKINSIIHCGDVCSQETLKYILDNFKHKVYLTMGNAEVFDVSSIKYKVSRIKIYDKYTQINIAYKVIGFVHKKQDIPDLSILNTKYLIPNTVFYGHSHKPWIEKNGNTILANPGNVAGIHYAPTFAIYDTKSNKLELKIISKLKTVNKS